MTETANASAQVRYETPAAHDDTVKVIILAGDGRNSRLDMT